MIAVDQSQVEAEINKFINFISPTNRSNEKRHQVVAFIRDILHKSALLEGYVIECGSSSLKSYLPESDLDLVLLVPCGKNSREEMQCLTTIFNSWCDEIADKEEGKSTHYDMTIRNVEFVNARTKLAHCLVNNISVDITVNQIGSLLTLTFLEEADRLVGMDHLFKNSLLLIKNWCLHESSYYCGSPIIGAKSGMLSSYAISVMVLHIFNKYTNLTHPFSVLRSFLYTYMAFPWDTHVLTIDGVQPVSTLSAGHYSGVGTPRDPREPSDLHSISSLNSAGSGHSRRGSFVHHSPGGGGSGSVEGSNRFQGILDALAQHPALALYLQASSAAHHGRFTSKCCNIQDPVDTHNNLGVSVPRGSLMMISKACQAGFTHLENLLRRYPNSLTVHNHNNMSEDYAFGTHQQAQYDANNYKYNPKVKQMLKPVLPGNLGYMGSALPHNNSNISNNNTEYNPYLDSISNTNATTVSSVTNELSPNAPYRRGSRTIPSVAKPPFLAEFFPTSLALYCSPEGEPLRCDLLNHPLQPLSTSSLLANPNYNNNNTNNSVHSGSFNRPRVVSASNVFADMADCVSVTSQVSAATDLMSATASETHATAATTALSKSNLSVQTTHSAQSTRSSVVDPLLGDLRAMYEALDLYVSSRRLPSLTDKAASSAKRSPLPSAQSSVSGSMCSAQSFPAPLLSSLPPLPALPLPLSALTTLSLPLTSLSELARYASPGGGSGKSDRVGTRASTPSSTVKYTPAVMSPKALSSQLKAREQSPLKTLHAHTQVHSSPTGSTTSGTNSDSPRQRASISISSDSDSGDEGEDDGSRCHTESESEEDIQVNAGGDSRGTASASMSRKLDLSMRSADKVVNATSSTTSAAVDSTESSSNGAIFGPVGSIVAFFRTQKVYQFCSELPAQLSGHLAALRLTTQTAAEPAVDAPSARTDGSAVAQVNTAQGAMRNRKRTASASKGPSSTANIATSSGAGVVANRSAALAAAATRRSKRGVTSGMKKLNEVILAWLQERFELCVTQCKHLLHKMAKLWRQLIIALLYSALMIFTINTVMKSGINYSLYWSKSMSVSASYLSKMSSLPELFLSRHPSRSSVQDSLPYDDSAFGQYDFFSPAAEVAPTGGFGAAGHSSYAHMFPAARSAARAAHLMFSAAAAGESVQPVNAGQGGPLHVATHWVKEGDTISFGDFGTYVPKPTSSVAGSGGSAALPGVDSNRGSGNPSKAKSPQTKPTTAPTTNPARTTASTASSTSTVGSSGASVSSTKPRSPSEYVQKTQYVPKSEYVLATSAVVGSPYQYQWTKDGVNISSASYVSQPYFSIKKARMEDAGHYRCLRFDSGVPHIAPVLVMETVLQISKPPTVSLRPSHHEVKSGTTMFLNLAAEGTPPPLFQWYRNGYLVPGLTGMALLMEDVNSSHSGTYSCDVQNIAGGFLWLEASVLVVD